MAGARCNGTTVAIRFCNGNSTLLTVVSHQKFGKIGVLIPECNISLSGDMSARPGSSSSTIKAISIVFGSTLSRCAASKRALNPEEVDIGKHRKKSSAKTGKSPHSCRSVAGQENWRIQVVIK
jgi:hypothetical protein